MKNTLKLMIIIFLFTLFSTFIIIGLSFIILIITDFSFQNILFIVSLSSIILSLMSATSGDPIGLSLQGMGLASAQYFAFENMENHKLELKSKHKMINLEFSPILVGLLLSGLIGFSISYFM